MFVVFTQLVEILFSDGQLFLCLIEEQLDDEISVVFVCVVQVKLKNFGLQKAVEKLGDVVQTGL